MLYCVRGMRLGTMTIFIELSAPNSKPRVFGSQIQLIPWERAPCTSMLLTRCIIVNGWSLHNGVLCKRTPRPAEVEGRSLKSGQFELISHQRCHFPALQGKLTCIVDRHWL